MNGKCCAEIGSVASGWHACGRRAVLESHRVLPGGTPITLEFCERHERRARKADLPSIRVVKVVRNAHVHQAFRPLLNSMLTSTERSGS